MVWTFCTLYCLMPFAIVVQNYFGAPLVVGTSSLFHEMIQKCAQNCCLLCATQMWSRVAYLFSVMMFADYLDSFQSKEGCAKGTGANEFGRYIPSVPIIRVELCSTLMCPLVL